MKKRKSTIQKNLDKVRKSGFLSEKSMKIYEEDLRHIIVVLNEKEEVVKVDKSDSHENKMSIFFLSTELLTETRLKKLIENVAPKFINSYKNYVHTISNTYQKIDLLF